MFATEPAPTRFDLTFSLFGIPVRIHPLFWLMGFLLGGSVRNLLLIALWIAIVFVSILIHELGHALAMRTTGSYARIVLYVFGGLTIPESSPWGGRMATRASGPAAEIFVSAAGALAGFLFAGIVLALVSLFGGQVIMGRLLSVIPFPTVVLPGGSNYIHFALNSLLWVNIFWGLINLMPVFPLDGGSIAQRVLVSFDPVNGSTTALWVSVVTGALLALIGIVVIGSIYVGLLFGYLAFASYQSLNPGFGRRW
jgi:stage IV sporulation protein FB